MEGTAPVKTLLAEPPTRDADAAAGGKESPADRYGRECRAAARRLVCTDFLVLTALAGVLLLLSHLIDFPSGGFALRSGLLFAATAPFAFAIFGLYSTKSLTISPFEEARALAMALVTLSFSWLLLGMLVRPGSFGRPEAEAMIVWLPFAFLLSLVVRGVVRGNARRRRPERILVVGAGKTGQLLAGRIINSVGDGVEVVGFVDDNPLPIKEELRHIPILPERDGLDAAVRATGATRLVLAFSQSSSRDVLENIRTSDFGRLPVSIVPRYFEITPAHSTLSELDGIPLIDLKSAQLSRSARITKRALDLSVSIGSLILLSPLFAAVAIAIKLDSRGPVFFRQERLGSRGRPFRIWKFRTMYQDAESKRFEMAHLNEMENSGPLFKIKDDPRVTRVGRFLRRTSIDELPQLFNVVSGKMSLVGPRPFVTHEAVQIDGWGARRLDLTPGITGLWQVRGRNDIPFDEMVQLDYMYVTNWSVWWDLRLLLQTVPRVLSQRGAS
jgi:exopolysaccharide biosynthesis polyprenyl glycosylphosphotransferase